MFGSARQAAKNKVDGQSLVPVDVFVGNGSRLSDKTAVEDYHANSIVSHEHRMSFKMRPSGAAVRHDPGRDWRR